MYSLLYEFGLNYHISLLTCIGDHLVWYRRTVGCYRTAVGYYRVIAQKTRESKSSHQDLLRTQKIIEIGPITAENDKNEKGRIFFDRNTRFSFIFLETSDLTTTCTCNVTVTVGLP